MAYTEILIKCSKCGITFTLQEDYLKKKDNLICPNCSTEFSQSQFNYLKDGVKQLSLVKELANYSKPDDIQFSLKYEL